MAGGPRVPWGSRRHLAGRGRGSAGLGSRLVPLALCCSSSSPSSASTGWTRPCWWLCTARAAGALERGSRPVAGSTTATPTTARTSWSNSVHSRRRCGWCSSLAWVAVVGSAACRPSWCCSSTGWSSSCAGPGCRGAAHSWHGAGPERPCVLLSVPSMYIRSGGTPTTARSAYLVPGRGDPPRGGGSALAVLLLFWLLQSRVTVVPALAPCSATEANLAAW